MMSDHPAVQEFAKFDLAEKALAEGQVVGGTILPDGTPVYFTVALDATEAEVRDMAFQIREGRLLGDAERNLIALAELVHRKPGMH